MTEESILNIILGVVFVILFIKFYDNHRKNKRKWGENEWK